MTKYKIKSYRFTPEHLAAAAAAARECDVDRDDPRAMMAHLLRAVCSAQKNIENAKRRMARKRKREAGAG